MPQLLLFGDSITWGAWDPEGGGWAARLRREIDGAQHGRSDLWCPVYNLGIPGETAAGVAARFESEALARRDPDQRLLALAAVGINDSQLDSAGGAPRELVPLESYRAALQAITSAAVGLKASMVLLGLTPVDERLTNPVPWFPARSYLWERAELFNRACEAFCRESGVPFIDIWSEFAARDFRALLDDGLHPNSGGHRLIFEAVRRFLIESRFLSPGFFKLDGP